MYMIKDYFFISQYNNLKINPLTVFSREVLQLIHHITLNGMHPQGQSLHVWELIDIKPNNI